MRERPVQFLSAGRRRFGAVLLGIVLVGLLPACSGGATKADPDDWTSDLCAAAEDLSEERADALLDFFEVDPNDGEAMYDGFDRYLKRYLEALDDFDRAMDEAGQPDVKDGNKLRKAVDEYAGDERKAHEDARDELQDLDKSDEGLAADVDDIFFDIEFADLRELLEDSEAEDSGLIIDLIEEDSSCAYALFAD